MRSVTARGVVLLGLLLSASASARAMPPLKLPAGFHATLFAQGFAKPRLMAVAPSGDVFLSDQTAGKVYVLPDKNKDGVADSKIVFASGLDRPHGLAFHGGYLYVAENSKVVRYAYKSGQTTASGKAQQVATLPADGEHETRSLAFGPDGRMYISIGSSCNDCTEKESARASVRVFPADGGSGTTYASGLRNAVGIVWVGNTLYSNTNGRDYLGDNVPPEAFFKLQAGGYYGWPQCLVTGTNKAQTPDPNFPKASCAQAVKPFATVTAHAAPLGLTVYSGAQFPGAYKGQLIAALHGSSIRKTRSGYAVVRINPQTGAATPFITGFLNGQTVLGRPVGVTVALDGSLLVSDDMNSMVYDVRYGK